MLAALSFSINAEPIEKMQFVRDQPFLVVMTASYLHVWNLTSQTVAWSMNVSAIHLVADPISPTFAIVERKHTGEKLHVLALFTPLSPIPIYSNYISSEVHGITFTPGTTGSRITYLDERFELCTIANKPVQGVVDESSDAAVDEQLAQRSLFTSIYGESIYRTAESQVTAAKERQKASAAEAATTGSQYTSADVPAALSFLQVPSHIVAAPSKLINPFLEQMLRRHEQENNDAADQDNGAMDMDASDEKAAEGPGGLSTNDVLEHEPANAEVARAAMSFLDGFFKKMSFISAPAATPAPSVSANAHDATPTKPTVTHSSTPIPTSATAKPAAPSRSAAVSATPNAKTTKPAAAAAAAAAAIASAATSSPVTPKPKPKPKPNSHVKPSTSTSTSNNTNASSSSTKKSKKRAVDEAE
eukprot:jgi/Hompol1/5382/HPOL_004363-RA